MVASPPPASALGALRGDRGALRVDAVEPGLEGRLVPRRVAAAREEVRAQAHDAAGVVAPEEAVRPVGRADAEELRGEVVDDAVERPGLAERGVDRVPDARVTGDAQGGAEGLHRVGPAGR